MDNLTNSRNTIDEIDEKMALLFVQRMKAVREVAQYKRKNNIAVLDEKREEEIINKNKARVGSGELHDLYETFLRNNMALSRAYQKRLLAIDTVAYQGVLGAYSHIALTRLFPHANAVSYATFEDVFVAVKSGEAEIGILPLENSFAGDVSEVLDLCFAHNCHVRDVYDLQVEHCLLGKKGAKLSDIKQVLSHPQAISQCNSFLKSHSLKASSSPNTAVAAKCVAQSEDTHTAAIASKETAELYGLDILAEKINTNENNTTRFIVIGKALREKGNRFSLLFTVAHSVGSLAKVIQAISSMGFNMECIKSRPMPNLPWEYYFYTELVGDINEENGKVLLLKLGELCQSVRILGVYHK